MYVGAFQLKDMFVKYRASVVVSGSTLRRRLLSFAFEAILKLEASSSALT